MIAPSKWHAVARSRAVRDKPLRVVVDGEPLVLFRAGDGLRCLLDRCPHRFAPLSGGRIVAGQIECPYHGWRFDGAGRCRLMPGLYDDIPTVAVPTRPVCERGCLVFVSHASDPGEPYLGALSGPDVVTATVESRVRARLLDVAENILDATHTHFTHKSILRGLSSRRYRVHVTVTGGEGWVEARYEGEPRQEGLISRLLEGERSISVGRFVAPASGTQGIAELEFWGQGRINLATTFHLRQEYADTVHGFGVLAGPRQGGLGHVKAALFKPFFRIALKQDQRILEAATDNRRAFGATRPVVTALDVLRPHIEAILDGRRPAVADAPVKMTMEL